MKHSRCLSFRQSASLPHWFVPAPLRVLHCLSALQYVWVGVDETEDDDGLREEEDEEDEEDEELEEEPRSHRQVRVLQGEPTGQVSRERFTPVHMPTALRA